MTIRLSISSLACTVRTLVAVGTDRLADMFSAARAAAPRRRISLASAGTGTVTAGVAAAVGAVGATAAVGPGGRALRAVGAAAAGARLPGAPPVPGGARPTRPAS